jgi:murein DD-endopeptidase MepM/ murein hydrolase activator NlpD
MLTRARAAGLIVLVAALALVTLATAVGLGLPPSATAVIRPIAFIKPPPPVSTDSGEEGDFLASRRLAFPVPGLEKSLRDNFDETRGGARKHEALDIMAPRGTPVVAVDDGKVAKLFRSAAGGITVYQFDPSEKYVYYYAHLDRYAEGLVEGLLLKRGDPVGYVGSTGNAPENAPHLHFTMFRMGPDKRWWKGTAVNPYPYLTSR